MAASPAFAATPNNGSAQISATADTSYTAPANTVTLLTAGASGSRVDEIDMVATGITVAGVINVFRKNGSNYYMLDSFIVPIVTPSTTTSAYRQVHTYQNLLLKSGDSIVASSWAASQLICASAFGGDF